MDENLNEQTSENKKLPLLLGGGLVLLLVLSLGGYFLNRETRESNSETMTTLGETTESLPADSPIVEDESMMDGEEVMEEGDGVVEIEVHGGSYYFTPDEIRVKKGDTVRITFVNDGGMHDWVIDEFDARTDVTSSGETDSVEFVADEAGEFEYYCSVGNHREMGMVGSLIVEE